MNLFCDEKWYIITNFILQRKITCCHKFYFVVKIDIYILFATKFSFFARNFIFYVER